MNFEEQYNCYRTQFERLLECACEDMNFQPPILAESMKYSLLSGGKRLRPVLFFAALDAFGRAYAEEKEIALALECIHTFSLIHDDLPAMDNDDFRRGKPTNHKKFGEANAILAGDALFAYASSLLLEAAEKGENHLRAAQAVLRAAGPLGMVAGQSADLLYGDSKTASARELTFIHAGKTGAMIAASVGAAELIAGREGLKEFSETLGLLFQLTDDFLDSGEEGRLTALTVYGKAGAEALADEYEAKCLDALHGADIDTKFLCGLTKSVRRRKF